MADIKITLASIQKEVIVIHVKDNIEKIKLRDGVILTVDKNKTPFDYKLSFKGSSFTGQPNDFADIYLKIQAIAELYKGE